MKIGFTGTQKGLTIDQHPKLVDLLKWYDEILYISEFHHGDCVGADEQAHGLVRRFMDDTIVVVHPPINPAKRAFCKGDETRKQKDYLDRNHDIVDETELLIACPKEMKEELRSGTWATIRYARRMKKKVRIILPDGNLIGDEVTGLVE